jgi:hypothetical protein
MAPKTHPTPPAPPTATPPAATVGTPPKDETYDWDSLLSAAPMVAAPAPTYAAGTTIDVLAEIPKGIRQRAEHSLSETVKAFKTAAEKGTNVKNVIPPWQLQPVGTVAMGEKFKALVTRYCRYRPEPENGKAGIEFQEFGTPNGQLTVRAGEPKEFPIGENGKPVLCVRFVVKPFEARKDTKAVK